jgi:hypothetical protein
MIVHSKYWCILHTHVWRCDESSFWAHTNKQKRKRNKYFCKLINFRVWFTSSRKFVFMNHPFSLAIWRQVIDIAKNKQHGWTFIKQRKLLAMEINYFMFIKELSRQRPEIIFFSIYHTCHLIIDISCVKIIDKSGLSIFFKSTSTSLFTGGIPDVWKFVTLMLGR